MKYARAFLPAFALTAVLSAPATAQTTLQPWRAHVAAFTDKLYGAVTNTHNRRDYRLAKKLAASDHVELDDDVIFAAAMLHDVGSMTGWEVEGQEHGDTAAAKLDQMLAGTDFPKDKMDRVRVAMRTHMFYREAGTSPEARYLHDADTLDAVGAVGLASLLEAVDHRGGNNGLTSQKAIQILTGDASKIVNGVVTPAGKAEMAIRAPERKAFLDQLARETDNFNDF